MDIRTRGHTRSVRSHDGSLRPIGAAMMTAGLCMPALAEQPAAVPVLPEVVIQGAAPAPYKPEVLSSPKRPQAIQDIPQTIQVVSEELMDDQGTRTLRDALRNVTGISFQAGEGNPPSGDQLKIRGFSARDDILVDGVRDAGVFFRDPFNTERIEVSKGPASAFAGRGSTGGTINQVSKLPTLKQKREIEAGLGTDSLFRVAADINQPLESLNGAAFRLNLMSHQADQPGRDHVENRRFGIAPRCHSVSARPPASI
jgi:catecholate siderophore receptor